MDLAKIVTLISFNYHEWKSNIEILFNNRGLYIVIMALEIDSNVVVEKEKWHNMKDEAYGLLCISLSLSRTSFPS